MLRGIQFLGSPAFSFLRFAVDLSVIPREFHIRGRRTVVPPSSHLCGIMMGEGLSGIYLNVTSCSIRAVLKSAVEEFQFTGSTTEEADEFILENHWMIQEFLDHTVPTIFSYDPSSCQSGDDVVVLHNDRPHGPVFSTLILLYRVWGLIPSGSTFYSSERYGTFTEEGCFRLDSGWKFLDTMKARLFLPELSGAGISKVVSNIRQISYRARYLSEDKLDICIRCVDQMINQNPILRDRISRYELDIGMPASLGGLDHPIGWTDWYYSTISEPSARMISFLESCTDEEFFDIKYASLIEFRDGDQRLSEVSHMVFRVFTSLEVSDDLSLHEYPVLFRPETFLPRDSFHGYVYYIKAVDSLRSGYGLVTIDEFIGYISSSLGFLDQVCGDFSEVRNPLISRRNRKEFLVSKVPPSFQRGPVTSQSCVNVCRRFRSSPDRYFDPAMMISLLDLDYLPSFSILFPRFHG